MPELPEVETVAADLRQQLIGRRFSDARILWPRTLAEPDPASLAIRLAGREVVAVARRGKYLVIALDSGESLIIHLRMTGRLEILPSHSPVPEDGHVRARFDLLDGDCLVFTDARKFGRVWLVQQVENVTGKLGPEPLDWTFVPEVLGERLAGRRAAMKALLLDQTAVAGLGNIYADEALFLAGIHPLRRASDLGAEEIACLCAAIRQVLNEAIGNRGTTLRDYRPPYGPESAHQNHLRVYQRAGRPCPRCGTPIERIRVAQRSTHFCPRCQPAVSPDN